MNEAIVAALSGDADCTLVSRNAGSGTRIFDRQSCWMKRPPGYGVQTKSHNAVAAAVVQGARAD
ncbi:MAG: hypothetical protein H6969_01165 [Gammaproteobacteria bacterium]|nr:hypothetical protein [Gammaproteobacteria bacterium]